MMRKALLALAATTTLLVTPAVTATAETTSPTAVTAERDSKMGALPAHYKICVANGIAGYNTEYVLEKWTQLSYGALQLVVQNRCTGYSITNRLTVDTYLDPDGLCGKYTNVHKTWSPGQGKYIYDQNPIVWINLRPECAGYSDVTYAHYLSMYVGYILGLNYETNTASLVMGSTSVAIHNVKYVTSGDLILMANVYGLTAKK